MKISHPKLLITAALFPVMSFAATYTAQVGFTTIADVTITPVTEISFGTQVFGISGDSCTLDAFVGSASATGALSGDCLTGTGQYGEYTIGGQAGQVVNLSFDLSGMSGTDFTLSLTGETDTDTATNPGGEATINSGGVNPVTMPAGGSFTLYLGGTLNIVQNLTPSTPYNDTFVITATY
ncbi:DUF4402 domain-containing protein [Flocculibacter collagenilyticus]|uniref:DUF4402 domain-containing protein n=1 Tax=Flocculibacter collagenilyticus TaxID=2744479 RepID=UPI0018F4BD07|nr:DUF4402 domain-containing protein [Flocculibacter collagenilyticus]